MRYIFVLVVLLAACGDSNGPSTSGSNFSITNRSADPATVVLHQNTWDGASWTELPDTAFLLTVQPGVCTDTSLNLEAVTGSIETPDTTFTLDRFGLYDVNAWTVTVVVDDGAVARAARSRGEGCQS